MQNESSGIKYTLHFLSRPYWHFLKKLSISFCSAVLAVFTALALLSKAYTCKLATEALLNIRLQQRQNQKVTSVSNKPKKLSHTTDLFTSSLLTTFALVAL